MIERKKKLRLIQLTLLICGLLIIYNTYYNKKTNLDEEIISQTNKNKIKEQKTEIKEEDGDIFFNVEYSGLDLSGNRYMLKSKEAYFDEKFTEIVYMNSVNAVFYFKNDSNLYVSSDQATYNTKNLNMKFEKNVEAKYQGSKLFADKAEYSNSESYLSIYENLKVIDIKGSLVADKLLFDIKNQELDITSFNDGNINANINLNEKRF